MTNECILKAHNYAASDPAFTSTVNAISYQVTVNTLILKLGKEKYYLAVLLLGHSELMRSQQSFIKSLRA